MLIFILTRLISAIELLKCRLTYLRDRLAYNAYLRDTTFREIRLKAISKSERCEVCHQSDMFDPDKDYCDRCKNISNNINYNINNSDLTRKEIIDSIKDEKEKSSLTLTSLVLTCEEIKRIRVEHEDGLKDALEATICEHWNSEFHTARRKNPYNLQIKSSIESTINQLGIDPNRFKYKISNNALNDSMAIIDIWDKEKVFLKLNPNDWIILDVLFERINKDGGTFGSLFDPERILEKTFDHTLVLYPHQPTSFEKGLSIKIVKESLNVLTYDIKAVNYYNYRIYNTLYGTSYNKGDYFIINDYGVKLVVLKNAILEMNPWFFDSLYRTYCNEG